MDGDGGQDSDGTENYRKLKWEYIECIAATYIYIVPKKVFKQFQDVSSDHGGQLKGIRIDKVNGCQWSNHAFITSTLLPRGPGCGDAMVALKHNLHR